MKSSHVTEDREYVCRVVSGKFSSSPPQDTSVQLSVYGEILKMLFVSLSFGVLPRVIGDRSAFGRFFRTKLGFQTYD